MEWCGAEKNIRHAWTTTCGFFGCSRPAASHQEVSVEGRTAAKKGSRGEISTMSYVDSSDQR